MIKNKFWFTLIEIILAMTVFAIIMTSILLSVENLSIARIRTENRVKLLEELYYFSEQLASNIKEWWTIDYEEYWNRQGYWNTVLSGAITMGAIGWAYSGATGVGNYGAGGSIGSTTYGGWLYYCTSSGVRMGTGGCLSDFNKPTNAPAGMTTDYAWTPQRYGQYALQFMDYNSNVDGDGWDEDGNGSILDDEDDKDLGNGPTTFSGALPELYLVNLVEYPKKRTFFRYVVRQDPNAYSGTTLINCSISNTWALNDGCMGNVQVLRMTWLDIGYTHSWSTTDPGAFDGKVDTWILHPDWPNGVAIPSWQRLATGTGDEWVDLFPNSINVKSLQFTLYPQKDPWISWDAQDCDTASCVSPFIHPYVRLQMTVWFAWGKRRALKWDDPTISVNTTISLADRE